MKPLKENWTTIVKALVEHMKVQIKMNVKMRCVELRTYEATEDVSAIQKSEEFLKAFMCGFDLQDSIAMLRLEDLYLETFEIKDGKICFNFSSQKFNWRSSFEMHR
jgi:RNA-binding protein PNO1